ncbi:RES family NAD+ phosphorylase [Tunicatimonas pelagia]|uniref:RES family NAD+ phosphorylase n=1 Tax=Tunicatimonas pelagia TaxID=931531 RepID=UPI0026660F7B|nr:RES family NAD+ phosphorylase [Tunicatimonas pelagia]WKN45127.1 RES family NAD+ phosphorylase [Tunicatimonas pelagia]
MEVFRIVKAEYANELFASGRTNRWNYTGEKVLYTAASRSLACLENLVHASGEILSEQFTIMVIYIPDDLAVTSVRPNELPSDWFQRARHPSCQAIGSQWFQTENTPILKVPSAIMHQEFNYVLNTQHSDYKKIQLIDQQSFAFDPRFKQNQFE